MRSAARSISAVFPAHNEEGSIEHVVSKASECLDSLSLDWEIIVVDDGSRDRTGPILDRLARRDARVSVVRHPTNLGYGAALRSGILSARKEWVFLCDSDLQLHPYELQAMLVWTGACDAIVGYRAERQDPWFRRLNAAAWRLLLGWTLGLRLRDVDCSLKLLKRSLFEHIQLDSTGSMVSAEILLQALRLGFVIKEIPVTHYPRTSGKPTGANPKVIMRALRELLVLRPKLLRILPIRAPHDRRKQRRVARGGGRRRQLLPINFPDRRQYHRLAFVDRQTYTTDVWREPCGRDS